MRLILTCLVYLAAASPALAQLVLPGAVAPSLEGSVQKPLSPARPKAKSAITFSRISGLEAVTGRSLHLNGAYGTIELAKNGDQLSLNKLTLAGNMISRPGDSCQVEVVSGNAAPLTPIGKPEGLLRYETGMPACPFAFDIVDGGLILKAEGEVCAFTAADCNVRPNGMWGPGGNSISADQINADTRARAQSETALRASFRDLMARHHDRSATRLIASEQAAFSSKREEMCRDYVREDQHGFCDARFTEAKVASLRMRLGGKSEPGSETAPKKHRKKRLVPAANPAIGAPMPLN